MSNDVGAQGGRRDLIKKGAVIGAIAWVAPTIVSVPAASAATQPGTITLGQSGAEGIHDGWLAVMVIDLNTAYTNATASNQTITPDLFSFTAGTGDPITGGEVQPFVILDPTGVVTSIGSTRVGPFVQGATISGAFGGAAFTLAPGETFRLAARTVGVTGGSPIAFTPAGSASLTGGPLTADSGSLNGIGATPTEGTNPFTSMYDPRSYQMSATFDIV